MKAYIAIPTYNGGSIWEESAKNINLYTPKDTLVHVIDSSSKDNAVDIALNYGFQVLKIDPANFNHGGTRNLAVELHKDEFDIVIFLTQDAIPESNFFENIITAFHDPSVACAFGRQLPHKNATAIAKHARYFNYSNNKYISSKDKISQMGIKTVFSSNSFSAYRISTFMQLGGFPDNTILSEDMYFAAKAIMEGHKLAYCPDARVRHSHNYNSIEEFKRYFDIGVFHTDESWIRENFGGAGGEGLRFIKSEFNYLIKNKPTEILSAGVHNFAKIVGYKLGQNYKKIPKKYLKNLSMHKRYWS